MTGSLIRFVCLAFLLSYGGRAAAAPAVPARYVAPIALHPAALGSFVRPISSTTADAQAFFNQGFQLMYAFGKVDAVRSFRESWKRDPTCAICYWGEAWAWGSYLNGPMTAEEAPGAYTAIQKAIAMKAHATAKEQAFIGAMAVRYVKDFDPARRIEQDRAYADAERVYRDELEDHPHNGWSLLGLQQALKARGGSRRRMWIRTWRQAGRDRRSGFDRLASRPLHITWRWRSAMSLGRHFPPRTVSFRRRLSGSP